STGVPGEGRKMIIAHLSDLHLDDGPRAEERVAAAMAYLDELAVAAVVVTGDIADHGAATEHARAAQLLKHPAPGLLCPGNHDVRAAFRTGLLGLPASDGPIDVAQEVD